MRYFGPKSLHCEGLSTRHLLDVKKTPVASAAHVAFPLGAPCIIGIITSRKQVLFVTCLPEKPQ